MSITPDVVGVNKALILHNHEVVESMVSNFEMASSNISAD